MEPIGSELTGSAVYRLVEEDVGPFSLYSVLVHLHKRRMVRESLSIVYLIFLVCVLTRPRRIATM